VDWLLDPRRDDAVACAVRALRDHLERHTNDEETVPAAVDELHAALREQATDTPLWLHLDWTRVFPTLSVRTVPDADVTDGHGFAIVAADRRETLRGGSVAAGDDLRLSVPREVVVNFDPDVVSQLAVEPDQVDPSTAAVALAAATEAHPVATPDQVAAAAGAMLADTFLQGHDELADAQSAVSQYLRLLEALGGSGHAVTVGGDHAEVAVDRSPFGSAITHIPSLSRVLEGAVGRIAARVNGKAVVVHDESMGLGDPADRIQIYFTDVEEEVCGSAYAWPPSGTHGQPDTSPRLEMTVSLPRQSHSVPVIRRLAAQILRAFGVDADDIHDVELAISEACANVIQHAVDSDGYEVSIELAADRCAITVLDRGEGFEPSQFGGAEDLDAESGRGLSLMRALVDNLNFVSEPKIGAVVHMVKQLEYDDSHPFRRTGT
jgi:serine/threonine-protein kinase RsbW